MNDRKCFIGKELNLKTRDNLIKVKVVKKIASMPAMDLFKAVDVDGVYYLFTVYYGLRTIYSIGLFDDGLYGTKSCQIKFGFIDMIKKIKGFYYGN